MTLPAEKLITINDRGARVATTFGSVTSGGANMVFIKKLTASTSSTLTFHNGTSSVVLDSTYKEYIFTFNNLHPSADDAVLQFQGNVVGGADFNETITSTSFRAKHDEADTSTSLAYQASGDQANGTSFQPLARFFEGGDNDGSLSGQLHIFNPSDTTFVKHFIARTIMMETDGGANEYYTAGYFNTTAALDEFQFSLASGTIDSGDICLYGIL